MSTIVSESQSTRVLSSHPPFCEGGIGCEGSRETPADWQHQGRETTWHAGDTRLSLRLTRSDGCSSGTYRRGEVEVELTMTDTACLDTEGNEVSVVVELGHGRLGLLLDFLREYQREAVRSDHVTATDPAVYDMPDEDLPRRQGMTKAQRVWNAIALGEDYGRAQEA